MKALSRRYRLSAHVPAILLALLMILSACGGGAGKTDDASLSGHSSAAEYEPPQPEQSYTPHGDFLWEVKGGAGTLHLMGTMHVLKRDYAITPEILDLFDAADALSVESNLIRPDVAMGAMDYAYYSDGSLLFDHLSERAIRHLSEMAELYGLDIDSIKVYHANSISSLFSVQAARSAGYSLMGVDMMLLLRANEQLKPIFELEDFRETSGSFLTLPDDTLERMCILTITPPEDSIKELDAMYDVYISGDETRMSEYLNDEDGDMGGDGLPIEFEEKDDLYHDYMLTKRNKIMAESISEYLEQPGSTFVAAGLAHFLGECSVIELLEERGYTVERVNLSAKTVSLHTK